MKKAFLEDGKVIAFGFMDSPNITEKYILISDEAHSQLLNGDVFLIAEKQPTIEIVDDMEVVQEPIYTIEDFRVESFVPIEIPTKPTPDEIKIKALTDELEATNSILQELILTTIP